MALQKVKAYCLSLELGCWSDGNGELKSEASALIVAAIGHSG